MSPFKRIENVVQLDAVFKLSRGPEYCSVLIYLVPWAVPLVDDDMGAPSFTWSVGAGLERTPNDRRAANVDPKRITSLLREALTFWKAHATCRRCGVERCDTDERICAECVAARSPLPLLGPPPTWDDEKEETQCGLGPELVPGVRSHQPVGFEPTYPLPASGMDHGHTPPPPPPPDAPTVGGAYFEPAGGKR